MASSTYPSIRVSSLSRMFSLVRVMKKLSDLLQGEHIVLDMQFLTPYTSIDLTLYWPSTLISPTFIQISTFLFWYRSLQKLLEYPLIFCVGQCKLIQNPKYITLLMVLLNLIMILNLAPPLGKLVNLIFTLKYAKIM